MFLRTVSIAALSTALAACGGSSSPTPPASSAPPPPPATGSSTTISTTGVITGFGSIFVNGVKYEIENGTVIAVEDEPVVMGDDSVLRLGMLVSIRAREENGARIAESIGFDEELKGPARDVVPNTEDPTIGAFTVVGQNVIVDANTVFDDDVGDNDGVEGIDIRDLDPVNFPGNAPIVVEVSGFVTEDGVIATRIDRVNAAAGDIGNPNVDGDELEVKGFVDSVAADGGSFVVNGATFIVTGSTIFEDGLAANADLVGAFVEVKADINSAGDTIAVRVEREDELDGAEDDDEFEIEGVLQSVDTTADPDVIVINGVTIEVTDASALVDLVGNRVEIKGAFNDAGVLVISESEIDRENTVRTIDRIASVDAAMDSFTTRLGVTVTATEMSRLQDKRGDNGDRLTPDEFIGRLMPNDVMDARGFPEGGGVIWTKVEREKKDDQQCRLRGPVDDASISDPTFSILGVTIDTTGLDDDDFEGADETIIGRLEFFSALAAGDVVQAKSDKAGAGCTDGALLTMTDGSVEFDDDDDVAGNEPEEPGDGPDGDDNEVVGAIRNLDGAANTFDVASRSIQVTADTLIDASIVERARDVELGDEDLRFGDLTETLEQLLSNGDVVEVTLDADGNAILIEDK